MFLIHNHEKKPNYRLCGIKKAVKPVKPPKKQRQARLSRGKGSPGTPDYRELHKIADKLTPIVQLSIIEGIRLFRTKVSFNKFLQAMEVGDIVLAESLIPWERFPDTAYGGLKKGAKRAIIDGGRSITDVILPVIGQPKFHFNSRNPRIADFVDNRIGLFVQNITEETQRAVSSLIDRSFSGGYPLTRTAKEISTQVLSHIGLSERDSIRESLESREVWRLKG